MSTFQSTYLQGVYDTVCKRNPNEPEFLQAVREVLESFEPVVAQRPDLVKRLNPNIGYQRLVNLVHAWDHEIKEMMGGMGINSVEALKGNRLMLRGIGLNEKELEILGIQHAGQ